jgi:hypothetical protein
MDKIVAILRELDESFERDALVKAHVERRFGNWAESWKYVPGSAVEAVNAHGIPGLRYRTRRLDYDNRRVLDGAAFATWGQLSVTAARMA